LKHHSSEKTLNDEDPNQNEEENNTAIENDVLSLRSLSINLLDLLGLGRDDLSEGRSYEDEAYGDEEDEQSFYGTASKVASSRPRTAGNVVEAGVGLD
jgi:hypothetical protein